MTEIRTKQTEISDLEPVSESNPLAVKNVGSVGHRFGGYQSVTVSSTSIGLAPPAGRAFTDATITVETAPVRFHVNPENVPTSSVGHVLDAGDVLKLESAPEIQHFKAIRKDGADSTLRVSYGR